MQERPQDDGRIRDEIQRRPTGRLGVFWGAQVVIFAGILVLAEFGEYWFWWAGGLLVFALVTLYIAGLDCVGVTASLLAFLGKVVLWALLASFSWFVAFIVTGIVDDNYTWGLAGLLLSIPLGASSVGLYAVLGLFSWNKGQTR